jgi:hypothetical protein
MMMKLVLIGCEGRCLNVNHLIKYESVSNYRFALPVRRGGRA